MGWERSVRAVAALAMLTASATGGRAQTASPPVDAAAARGVALLAAARAACGGAAWDHVKGWHERGRISVAGRSEGTYEAWAGITHLAMALTTAPAGLPANHAGTDGRVSWRVLPGGGIDLGPPGGPSRLHRRDAYLSNFGWFFPDRFPATATARDAQTIGATVFDVVAVRPIGDEDFDLWLDRETRHVARIVVGAQVAELRNYRTVAGVCAPTAAIQSDGNPAHTTRLDIDSVDTAAVPPDVFADQASEQSFRSHSAMQSTSGAPAFRSPIVRSPRQARAEPAQLRAARTVRIRTLYEPPPIKINRQRTLP